MTTPPDCNELARECADLRDKLIDLGQKFAESQERSAVLLAAMELDAGKTVDEVSERAYDDKDMVLQHVKDRVFMEGYIEALNDAEKALRAARQAAREEGR